MPRVGYRVPELGERVQMGKFATAFRGVWGQVIDVKFNEPTLIERGERVLIDGRDHTEIFILTDLTQNGRRVCVKASPYELDGGLRDYQPAIPDTRR
jgi:hypothetical protein